MKISHQTLFIDNGLLFRTKSTTPWE